ncbi:MAG: translation initiation factor IF-2 [Gammaproteobacteria bacterium]|nr:translation initiation factor IF-2 [Gammaproteobacteria bacterium]
MAEVTVSQLAKTVGASVDRLLAQMKEAGLDHASGEQLVSDEDKQRLLAHLKSSHGANAAAPKRITLKRRTIGTVKTSGSQGKKTVAVEVRKKRTYVKRDEAAQEEITEETELESATAAPLEVGDAGLPQVADATAAAEVIGSGEVEPAAEDASARRIDPFDVEELRRRAAAKRKEQETTEKARRDAVVRAKAEESARQKAEAAAKLNQANKERTGPKHLKAAPGTSVDDDQPKKKPGKSRKQPKQRGKSRGHSLRVDDFMHDDKKSGGIGGQRVLQAINKQEFVQPTETIIHEVELGESISVSNFAQQLAIKANVIIKELMKLGVMTNINQSIDQETAILVIEELGHKYRIVSEDVPEDELLSALADALAEDIAQEEARPPVVTVMGHVDHGKTSLLDYIRESRVASGEAGGITQHIGAYQVQTDIGVISFLDTPGHAAFTAMRARGAECTDIVVLVVAADDGVMPQTIEAIQHARAAGVPLVVAINKIDKEAADPERVKNELVAQEVVPEEWGGDTQFIPVSAQTGEGIDKLLEALSLQAEVLELTAAVNVPAKGIVIESRLEKGRGNVASILVQEGTLHNGDVVLAGLQFGRVRNMMNEHREPIEGAGPSTPVEILGLDGTPNAGDEVVVVADERKAREVAEYRRDKERSSKMARQQKANLDNIFASFDEAEVKTLNVIVKADVRGSTEAICSALQEIGNEEVEVNIVSSGVGAIADADVNLATATSAVVFGFNVRAEATARSMAERESIEIRYYSVIYNLLDDVKDALSGMLAPEKREEILGTAEVRDVFKSPKFGLVAGCMVVEGVVLRNKPIRVLRDNVVIHEGGLDSLRRFKEDVSEVRAGTECGIGVKDYTDVKEGDKIEVFDIHEVERSL